MRTENQLFVNYSQQYKCSIAEAIAARIYKRPEVEVYAYKKGSRWGIYMHNGGDILTPTIDGGLYVAHGQHCPDKWGSAPYKTLKALRQHYPDAKRHL
jgi:hypothetical protein